MKWGRLFISLLVATAPSSGIAAWYDGNEILSLCSTNPDVVAGYVSGSMDSDVSAIEPAYCVPLSAKLGQTRDVFCKYLKDNPADRHMLGSVLLRRALVAAWPCSRKGDRQ